MYAMGRMHPVAQWSRARLITCLNPKAASSIPAMGNWDFSLGKNGSSPELDWHSAGDIRVLSIGSIARIDPNGLASTYPSGI